MFVVHICTREKKVMVTEGNTTTPGIRGPQREEGSEYMHMCTRTHTQSTVKG